MEIRGQNWTLDELGWERLEEPPAPWDGLSDLYPALVNTVWGAETLPRYFRKWLGAIKLTSGS